VSYVIAGYALALATLAGYSGWMLRRRRRLERFFGDQSSPAAGR
jgi:hypothetical protein